MRLLPILSATELVSRIHVGAKIVTGSWGSAAERGLEVFDGRRSQQNDDVRSGGCDFSGKMQVISAGQVELVRLQSSDQLLPAQASDLGFEPFVTRGKFR